MNINPRSTTVLAIAATLAMFPIALSAQSPASMEAREMVPAEAVLQRTIDARKLQPGDQFRAKLLHNVRLDEGPELPAGSTLVGQVVSDDMQQGNAALALRFTEATLKNGETVPIKATIVKVFNPADDPMYYPGFPADENWWNSDTLAVDQLDVTSGVDLEGKIASPNSGVLFSKTKTDVKIPFGDEMYLAIAGENSNNSQPGSGE